MVTTTAPTLPAPCSEDPEIAAQPLGRNVEQAVAQALLLDTVADRGIELDTPIGDATAAAVPMVPELAPGLARPRYYPAADHKAQWFGDTWAHQTFTFLRAVVLHTTEGPSWPAYDLSGVAGSSAPNFTAKPDVAGKRLIWRQHFGLDMSARALRNPPGGVDTNTTNVIQIELVGTSAKGGPGMFWPDAPDWAIQELAKFLAWLNGAWGVKVQSSVHWKSYPGSYGTNNGVRLGGSDWLAYRGYLAHEHVPENDHGDCGLFPIRALLDATTAIIGGTDVPLTDAEIARIAKEAAAAVWGTDLTDDWHGTRKPASSLVTEAHRWTVDGNYAGKRPDGQPTLANLMLTLARSEVAQTDTLEAGQAAASEGLAAAVQTITNGVVGQLLSSGIVGVDAQTLEDHVRKGVQDSLAGTEFVARAAQ